MLYHGTELIIPYFEQKNGLVFRVQENADGSSSVVVPVGFNTDGGKPREIWITNYSSGNAAEMKLILWSNIPEERTPQLLTVLNECNIRYRFVKFLLYHGEISMRAALPMELSDDLLGPVAYEYVLHFRSIAHEAHSILLNVLWE